MENRIVIENLSKKFRIYHEKKNSIYESLTSIFQKKKYYEEIQILNDISFNVKQGELLGILGKNGTGKSTLLKTIAGIYKADSGNIIINGKLTPLLQLGTGFNLELTARENAILYGMLLGIPKKIMLEKLDDIIEFAELENFADIKIKNFSTGMLARLAFSTTIQINPDIYLLDEIIAVGDAGFQKKCFDVFLSLLKKNKSIILVSHDLNIIQTYCDRVMIMNNSKIEKIGEPVEVIKEYKKLY